MASDKKVDHLGADVGPQEPVVLRIHMLGMDNRRAQNRILDDLVRQLGRDGPNDSKLSPGSDDEVDIVEADLQIRRKLEYIRVMMNKAGEAGSSRLEKGNANLASETMTNTITKIAGELEKKTWEPPSPAKSTYAEQMGPPGHEDSGIAVKEWLDDPFCSSEDTSQAPIADLDSGPLGGCGTLRANFVDISICAGLEARTLALLWCRGVMDTIPACPKGSPALVTLDQLDSELLSAKLNPKEALSLLYDLQFRFPGGIPSGAELELKSCRLCDEFKLWLDESTKELDVLHEFPRWKTKSRCAHRVCNNCMVKNMLGAFDDALWMAAGGVKFHCPVPGCFKYLGQFSKGDGTPTYSVLLPQKDRVFMEAW